MIDIIEIPSGEVIEIRKNQLDTLVERGLVHYVTSYKYSKVNSWSFYAPYRQDIYDYLDRTIDFKEYLKRNG